MYSIIQHPVLSDHVQVLVQRFPNLLFLDRKGEISPTPVYMTRVRAKYIRIPRQTAERLCDP